MKQTLSVTWHGLSLQLDLDGALYWPEERLLVAADLHLEKGTSYARSAGRLLPPYDSAQTVARLERLIDAYRPLRVVALGDSFHDRRGAARLDGDVAERKTQATRSFVSRFLDPLSSRNKCNTMIAWCCHGQDLQTIHVRRAS